MLEGNNMQKKRKSGHKPTMIRQPSGDRASFKELLFRLSNSRMPIDPGRPAGCLHIPAVSLDRLRSQSPSLSFVSHFELRPALFGTVTATIFVHTSTTNVVILIYMTYSYYTSTDTYFHANSGEGVMITLFEQSI